MSAPFDNLTFLYCWNLIHIRNCTKPMRKYKSRVVPAEHPKHLVEKRFCGGVNRRHSLIQQNDFGDLEQHARNGYPLELASCELYTALTNF